MVLGSVRRVNVLVDLALEGSDRHMSRLPSDHPSLATDPAVHPVPCFLRHPAVIILSDADHQKQVIGVDVRSQRGGHLGARQIGVYQPKRVEKVPPGAEALYRFIQPRVVLARCFQVVRDCEDHEHHPLPCKKNGARFPADAVLQDEIMSRYALLNVDLD